MDGLRSGNFSEDAFAGSGHCGAMAAVEAMEEDIEEEADNVKEPSDPEQFLAEPSQQPLAQALAPTQPSELAVHHKKVETLQRWLRTASRGLLVLTGPPGCGKATAVRCIATSLGQRLALLDSPAPTIESERALLNATHEPRVRSFARSLIHRTSFASGASLSLRKSSASSSSSSYPSQSSSACTQMHHRASDTPDGNQISPISHEVVLVEDLPYAANEEAEEHLASALASVATRGAVPTVLVLTDGIDHGRGASRGSAANQPSRCGIVDRLMRSGAKHIEFPAVNQTNMKKAISRLCDLRNVSIGKEAIQAIATDAQGDIRASTMALELYLAGSRQCNSSQLQQRQRRQRGTKRSARGYQKKGRVSSLPQQQQQQSPDTYVNIDLRLQSLHALGKILQHKRVDDIDLSLLPEGLVHPQFRRAPLRDDPDEVVKACGFSNQTIVSFLHEHYLRRLQNSSTHGEDSLELLQEVSDASRHLSDSALLMKHPRLWNSDAVHGSIGHLTASVAARGVMFSSTRASTGKADFQLQSPAENQLLFKAQENAESIRASAEAAFDGDIFACGCSSEAAVDIVPRLREIATASPSLASKLPCQLAYPKDNRLAVGPPDLRIGASEQQHQQVDRTRRRSCEQRQSVAEHEAVDEIESE